ncbi:MAG: hypothetical protein MJ252_01555 [archaeon]|nr:hypothetical protein [archaeon]
MRKAEALKRRKTSDFECQTPKILNSKKRSSNKKSYNSTTSKSNISNKGPWTETEDKLLIDLVEKYGAEKWSFIANYFTDRIGKQCRERWFNHLNPDVKKSNWSSSEEWILFLKHREMGNRWSKLCEFLPGRTDNTIKNHWNSTMQKKKINLEKELKEMLQGKSEEEIPKYLEEFISKCSESLVEENKKFYDEKRKNYEKFKNIKYENRLIMSKLKKILQFRTHSKKTKKKGRKKKIFIRTYIEERPVTQTNTNPTNNNQSKDLNSNLLNDKDKNQMNFMNNSNEISKDKLFSGFYSGSKFLNTPTKDNMNCSYFKGFSIQNKEEDMRYKSPNNLYGFNSNYKLMNSTSNFNAGKSAFNKQIIPTQNEGIHYSSLKPQFLFSSSVKKPVKIVSDSNFVYDSNESNNENITPNRPIPTSSEFNKVCYNAFNCPGDNKGEGFLMDKTPMKTKNLEKVFFSVFHTDLEKTEKNPYHK